MPSVTELQNLYTNEKLQEIGRRLYGEKKYEEGLKFLTAAIKTAEQSVVPLLDVRAATYEKLNDLRAALRDGRQMLELDKTYVQGYLRTGKILQLMDGKAELAVKIYERGLRYSSSKSPHYEALHKAHKQLSQTLAPPEVVDIFAIFPLEVIDMIFSYIPFENKCISLRVSKSWNQFLTTWPALWSKIDLTRASRPVHYNSVKQYQKYAQGRVRELILHRVKLQGNNALDSILARSKLIEHLSILSGGALGKCLQRGTPYLTNLISFHADGDTIVDGVSLKNLLNTCPNLAHIRCNTVESGPMHILPKWEKEDFPNLRSYTMDLQVWLHENSPVAHLTAVCPPSSNLTSLHIRVSPIRYTTGRYTTGRCHLLLGDRDLARRWPLLEHLAIHNTSIYDQHSRTHNPTDTEIQMSLPRNLQSLVLVETGLFATVGPWSTCSIRIQPRTSLPKLKKLVVQERDANMDSTVLLSFLTAQHPQRDSEIEHFETRCGGLESIDIINMIEAGNFSNTRHLRLEPCPGFDDAAAAQYAATMTKLELIHLTQSSITGVGVKHLVTHLPNLKQLKFEYCDKIGQDAIQWARSQGIEVSVKLLSRA